MSKLYTPNNRNLNIDLLRIIAIYAIILIHCSGSFLIYNAYNDGAHWWIVSVIYSSILKWGAGVFVMISGAFMLKEEKSQDIWKFLKHRFIRIVLPFIVWALFYKIFENPQEFIQSKGLVLRTFIVDVYSGNVEYHLWFIYMLFILYLFTPVLSFLVNHAPKKILFFLVALWMAFNFIPDYLHQFKDWTFGSLDFLEFSKYSGLYILGYLLKDYRVKKPWKLWIPFILLVLVNAYGTYYLSNSRGYNDYFFLSRLNMTNIMNALLIYLFFISINWKKTGKYILKRNQFIIQLSLLSYGIFLNHVLILNILRSGKFGFTISSHSFLGHDVHPAYGAVILFGLTAVGSTLLGYLFSKTPIIKNIAN